MRKYNHNNIEKKWQKIWEKKKPWKIVNEPKGKKFYGLIEFPYPSGSGLHVGHIRSNTAIDIIARKRRAEGYSVLYPIGWDAFGLPTENYAIKTGIHPIKVTKTNTDIFRKQLKRLGFSFDWSREVNTTDPNYYRWTQWIFLQMYKKGLAYKTNMPINWCLSCKIGLANEEVVENSCERCGGKVEKRNKEQWMLAITKYAERLHKDLDEVSFLEKIKTQQRNWIGKSDGAEIIFPIANTEKRKVLIIHGFESSPNSGFKPWLAKELEKNGYEVVSPQLPNPAHPDYEETMAFLREKVKDFSDRDIVVGHSLGGLFAIKLSEERKFGKVIVVACSIGEMPYKQWKKDWKNSDVASIQKVISSNPINNSSIKADEKICIFSKDDSLVPYKEAIEALDKSWRIILRDNDDHYMGEKYIDILEAVISGVRVFTTRIDTIFGATYLVLSPEHNLVKELLKQAKNPGAIKEYQKLSSLKTDEERIAETKEKTGVKIEGVEAVNPISGEKIPIYISDYVLAHYGTGAIMAVPAHDSRDFSFAKKFNLPIKQVICGNFPKKICPVLNEAYEGDGHLVGSDEFDGLHFEEAKKAIAKKYGFIKTTYKLRDWIFSRQRYWGEPIPMISCKKCGWVEVPEKDLPIVLPKVAKYEPTDTGESPLSEMKNWLKVKCPKCKGSAERETDTMPNWAGSSWYFLRYCDPKNKKVLADKKALKKWTPIDWYNGGMEHTTLHLLYSRFWHKFLFDIGVVPTSEPYAKRTSHGMILAEGGVKMSKSKGNVINPDELVQLYGADTLRIYEMFMGPFSEAIAWDTKSMIGSRRFIERVWKIGTECSLNKNSKANIETERALHATIKKVGEDIEDMKFNTAIAQMMTFINTVEKFGVTKKQFQTFLQLLAPFAPHVSAELWQLLGVRSSIEFAKWPKFDAKLMVRNLVKIAVQINGKMRGVIEAPIDSSDETVIKIARSDKSVAERLGTSEIKKVIVVKNRIVSFVI